MTTLLLGLILAQNAVAAEPAACAEAQLAVARHDITEARDAYREGHKAFYAVDWKGRLATADDRDAILAERERRWEEVTALRDSVAEARLAFREVRTQAAEGTLACESPSGAEDTAQTDATGTTRTLR